MSKPDNQVNELHLREPQPGDFWHERFCPYHIVLAVTPDGVVITDKTKPDGSSHYTFELEAAKEITHEEHARAVRYSSGNGFAADVVPARAAGSVREWKAAGSKYIPIAEQQAAPHAGEALMDTNKMREQFEAAFIAEQVAKFGEGFMDSAIHLLKRDGAFLTNPSFYEVRRREQGMYDNYWVEMVWWAWQASREAVVVDLGAPSHWVADYVACGGGMTVFDAEKAAKVTDPMCSKTPSYTIHALEKAGLKVAS
ncbi:hypothetical protein GEV39_16660 [Pseudomonas sp. NY5710]|uniref:hypothetical protein n=1 Tax=Pseudomonas sp. NY5710 TaxID=2662033 RepID=UPI00156F9DF7|nr:hypothetical protein [Pseudomonas sp. NY5710]QKL02911.1 hypothetical protein GEV39_16660 [Pseudomonas sp. NY5710]